MKHNSVPPERRRCDGIQFRSLAEMDHYGKLKALQRQGVISGLQYEPKFTFIVNGYLVGTYKPDFGFIENGQPKIHDVKGFRKSKRTGRLLPRVDRGFRRTCKLMWACFGLEVEIV